MTKIFGYDSDKAYEEFLKEPEKVAQPKSEIVKPANIANPNEWIILPGTASYSDTLVKLERDLQENNWELTHRILQQNNQQMLTIRQYVDFLKLLKTGKVYNASGVTLSQTAIDAVLDDILTVRASYRAEWLDAKFEKKDKKMLINYNHKLQNGILVPQHSEELTDYLTKDKTPGIDLDRWLQNANPYGLPIPGTQSGNLYYWTPRDGNVAWFEAYANRAGLGCDWSPAFTDAGLGVRRTRVK